MYASQYSKELPKNMDIRPGRLLVSTVFGCSKGNDFQTPIASNLLDLWYQSSNFLATRENDLRKGWKFPRCTSPDVLTMADHSTGKVSFRLSKLLGSV
jgi:hypothetical protein